MTSFTESEVEAASRNNVRIDWTMRENVRANLRRLVKRILRKHGYPPDKQEKATRTVLGVPGLVGGSGGACGRPDAAAGAGVRREGVRRTGDREVRNADPDQGKGAAHGGRGPDRQHPGGPVPLRLRHHRGGPGTATTFDCITADGVFLGGVIPPGVRAGLHWLARSMAKLPCVELAPPPEVIGRRNEACIRSGVFCAAVGAVDAIVRRIRESCGSDDVLVVATGGFAPVIGPHASSVDGWSRC